MRDIVCKLTGYLLISLLLATAGCYDAGDKTECAGFACPAGGQWPEGGNITVSHVWLPDGVSSLRTFHAYFVSDQSPAFPEPRLPGDCFQIEDADFEFRNEIDVGEQLVLRGEGDEEFVLRRYTADDCVEGAANPPPNGCVLGRPVDFDFVPHDITYLLSLNTSPQEGYFDARITAETGVSMPFSNLLNNTYMPPAVTQTKPPFGLVPIKKGEPLELGWVERTPFDPEVVAMGTILLVDPFRRPDTNQLDVFPWLCITPNSGTFTIPGEVTEQLSPRGGILQVGYATNEAVVTEDERIINLFATECQANQWMLVE